MALKDLSQLSGKDRINILDPEWDINDNCHNWQKYIPEGLREVWDSLSLDCRVIAYYAAQYHAKPFIKRER